MECSSTRELHYLGRQRSATAAHRRRGMPNNPAVGASLSQQLAFTAALPKEPVEALILMGLFFGHASSVLSRHPPTHRGHRSPNYSTHYARNHSAAGCDHTAGC